MKPTNKDKPAANKRLTILPDFYSLDVYFYVESFILAGRLYLARTRQHRKARGVTSKPNRRHNNDQTDDYKHKMKR